MYYLYWIFDWFEKNNFLHTLDNINNYSKVVHFKMKIVSTLIIIIDKFCFFFFLAN